MQTYQKIYIANEDEWFWADTKLAPLLTPYRWVLEKKRLRLRALIENHGGAHSHHGWAEGHQRWTLQMYILDKVGLDYDYIYFLNGDKLDFRLRNLVPYDPIAFDLDSGSKNILRGSKKNAYQGVTYHKRKGLWQAVVTYRQKATHLGYFADAERAATVRRSFVANMLGPIVMQKMRKNVKRLPHKQYN